MGVHCPDSGQPRVEGTATYAYDANGNQTSETDPLGHRSTTTYDVLNRETRQTDPLSNTTETRYDAAGNTVKTIDALEHETTSTYDAAGRLTVTTDPLGHSTASSYDDAGELVAKTDANNHTTHYAYDADGKKVSVTAPGGAVTHFSYDAVGNLLSSTDPNGHTASYSYDAAGNKASKTNALGSIWHYSYDANRNLVETTTPSGGTIDQAYDSQNRLIHKGYSDGTPSVSYSYDAAGRKTQMTGGTGTILYNYDAAGQLLEALTPSGSFLYTYDLDGSLLSRTYPNGLATSYAYNESGELITATAQGQTTHYTYDADGNLVRTLHPNGIRDTRSYDASGRLTEVTGVKSDESPFYSRSYTYDPVGDPTQMTASTQGTNLIAWPSGDTSKSWQETYSYDSQNRLTHACMNSSCSRYYSYSFDAVGNRLSETTEQKTTTYSYDAADELTSETTGTDTTDYYYDANGNETQSGSTHYAYNLANELTQETKAGSEVSYTYAGNGLMATRSSSSATTNYSWDTSFDLPELASEGSRSYTYGVGPLGFVTSSGTYTYHTDSLGSVAELSDSSGSSVESYRYSPYGEADSSDGSEVDSALGNSLRYAGQYLDSETDLYDMRAREYDPDSGRFLEEDPLDEAVDDSSVGVYVYADDQPTVDTDPTGESVTGDDIQAILQVAIDSVVYATLDSRESFAYHYYRSKSLTKAQAAGLVGNLWWEGKDYDAPRSRGLNPFAVQAIFNNGRNVCPSDGPFSKIKDGCGFGIAQWTNSGRQNHMKSIAGSAYLVWDYPFQVHYVWKELTEGTWCANGSKALKDLKAIKTTGIAGTIKATNEVMHEYLGAGDTSTRSYRENEAKAIYRKYS